MAKLTQKELNLIKEVLSNRNKKINEAPAIDLRRVAEQKTSSTNVPPDPTPAAPEVTWPGKGCEKKCAHLKGASSTPEYKSCLEDCKNKVVHPDPVNSKEICGWFKYVLPYTDKIEKLLQAFIQNLIKRCPNCKALLEQVYEKAHAYIAVLQKKLMTLYQKLCAKTKPQLSGISAKMTAKPAPPMREVKKVKTKKKAGRGCAVAPKDIYPLYKILDQVDAVADEISHYRGTTDPSIGPATSIVYKYTEAIKQLTVKLRAIVKKCTGISPPGPTPSPGPAPGPGPSPNRVPGCKVLTKDANMTVEKMQKCLELAIPKEVAKIKKATPGARRWFKTHDWADGKCGPSTKKAIFIFQRNFGKKCGNLDDDGIVGKKTADCLRKFGCKEGIVQKPDETPNKTPVKPDGKPVEPKKQQKDKKEGYCSKVTTQFECQIWSLIDSGPAGYTWGREPGDDDHVVGYRALFAFSPSADRSEDTSNAPETISTPTEPQQTSNKGPAVSTKDTTRQDLEKALRGKKVPAARGDAGGVPIPTGKEGEVAEGRLFDSGRGFLLTEAPTYDVTDRGDPVDTSGVSPGEAGTSPKRQANLSTPRRTEKLFQVNYMKEFDRMKEMVDEYEGGWFGVGKDEMRLRNAKDKLRRLEDAFEGTGGFQSIAMKSDFVKRLRRQIRQTMGGLNLEIENIRYISGRVTFDLVRLDNIPDIGGDDDLIRHPRSKNNERSTRGLCGSPDGNQSVTKRRQRKRIRRMPQLGRRAASTGTATHIGPPRGR